jgi:hypothetical protein
MDDLLKLSISKTKINKSLSEYAKQLTSGLSASNFAARTLG